MNMMTQDQRAAYGLAIDAIMGIHDALNDSDDEGVRWALCDIWRGLVHDCQRRGCTVGHIDGMVVVVPRAKV